MVACTKSPKLMLAVVLVFVSSPAFAKRAPPKDVPPVIAGGIRYSAPPHGGGGYVEATDVSSRKLLWELRVYDIKIDPDLERDVQDIFITSLKVADGNLQVANETGDKFIVDLSKRKVTQGANRVYRFDERNDKSLPVDEKLTDGNYSVNAFVLVTSIVVVASFAVAFMRWRRRTFS